MAVKRVFEKNRLFGEYFVEVTFELKESNNLKLLGWYIQCSNMKDGSCSGICYMKKSWGLFLKLPGFGFSAGCLFSWLASWIYSDKSPMV